MRLNPEVLALARKVGTTSIPRFPGPGRFKGAVRVTLKDGRVFEEIEEYNRGSAENPMSDAELRAKFDDNASGFLSALSAIGLRGRLRGRRILTSTSDR